MDVSRYRCHCFFVASNSTDQSGRRRQWRSACLFVAESMPAFEQGDGSESAQAAWEPFTFSLTTITSLTLSIEAPDRDNNSCSGGRIPTLFLAPLHHLKRYGEGILIARLKRLSVGTKGEGWRKSSWRCYWSRWKGGPFSDSKI